MKLILLHALVVDLNVLKTITVEATVIRCCFSQLIHDGFNLRYSPFSLFILSSKTGQLGGKFVLFL